MVKRRIVILGAGISGLALAWFLRKKFGHDVDLTILEKSPRIGGWIQSIEKENFLFDLGPHSCRSTGSGQGALKLIEELNLQDQVIAADSSARNRFVLTGGEFKPLPTTLFSFLFSPLMRGVLPALWHDWRTVPHIGGVDESIFSFISRRFNRDIADRLMDPLTSGIYAGNIRELSVQSCFPVLYQWEQEFGSVVRGLLATRKQKTEAVSPFVKQMQRHPLFSFKEGMETLPRALKYHLDKDIELSCSVKTLHFLKEKIDVELCDQRVLTADYVFSALPAHALAPLLSSSLPELAQTIGSIDSTSVAVVNLGYRKEMLKQKGFGYLVPSNAKEDILGVIWDSSVFPQQNRSKTETRLTVMLGGTHRPDLCVLDHADLLKVALKTISRHLNINLQPDAVSIYVARSAIPQYRVGHPQKLCLIDQQLNGLSSRLFFLGSFFRGVSVNDCIIQAHHFATHLAQV